MTATVASIATAAQDLLDTAETALATTAAGFAGLAWLSPGMPAFDVECDFVAVWQGALGLAPSFAVPPSQVFRTGGRVHLVTLNVTTGRCVSRASQPPVAAKNADAVKHMEDGQALFVGVGDAIADGLFDGVCKQILPPAMVAYTPQGGFAGWNLTVQVQIDGYPV